MSINNWRYLKIQLRRSYYEIQQFRCAAVCPFRQAVFFVLYASMHRFMHVFVAYFVAYFFQKNMVF